MVTSKECLSELLGMQNIQVNTVLIALTTALILEARRRNDTAEDNDIYRNQGAIKELKALRKQLKPKGDRYQYDEAYQS